MQGTACELCAGPGGVLLWQDDRLRVVRVEDSDHPSFCRVIWNTHVKEFTDLPPPDREHAMHVACAVELSLRHLLKPDKINLASLGNMTPHLHWHVIPRFADDRHFPNPVWGAPQRASGPVPETRRFEDEAFRAKLVEFLGGSIREQHTV